MTDDTVRVASGQGFWGDWQEAPKLQVRHGPVDYLMLDYLAEITMSIMQKQRDRDPEAVYAFVHEALDLLARDRVTADELVGACLKCGEMNLRVMQMLDEGHVERFGQPAPVVVKEGTQAGPGILVLERYQGIGHAVDQGMDPGVVQGQVKVVGSHCSTSKSCSNKNFSPVSVSTARANLSLSMRTRRPVLVFSL